MKSSLFLLKIDPEKLAYLRFILEGYDHLAILSVLDPKKGLAKVHFFEREKSFVKEVLEDLRKQLHLEILDNL